jgi:hypothetical protein
MSVFSILDYLDQLDNVKNNNTWISASCPHCKGKLKINKNTGSYACYTNECHLGFPNKIRDKLFTPNAFNAKNSFSNKSLKVTKIVDVVKPKKDFSNVEATNFLTSIKFEKPKSIRNLDKLLTYFDYGQFNVVRIDYFDIYRDKNQFYQHTDREGNLIDDIPKQLTSLPIYKKDYISDCILFVEGEKCATITQKLGFNCITIPTFLYNSVYLPKVFSFLSKKVKNILVLNDNDDVGRKKAKDICLYGWKYGINTDVLDIVKYYSQYQHIQGFDIYDLYKEENLNTEQLLWLISLHLKTLYQLNNNGQKSMS